MIVPYYGEFLTSPAPLELSLNWCSHNCAYCFANLNSPTRTGDYKGTLRFLSRFMDADTLEAQLLQYKYPTVVSNKVDPFSASNDKQLVPIIKAMQDLKLPVVIQTKGGKLAQETATWLKPSVWYVTIETDDDTLSKKIAPGAPTYSERIALIKHLINRGHKVVVGHNPAVNGWLKNPSAFFKNLKSLGVTGTWIAGLHLSKDQIKNMSERQIQVIPEDTFTHMGNGKSRKPTEDYVEATRQLARDAGLEVFHNQTKHRTDFFKPYRDTYENTFPVMQDFLNALHDTEEPEVEISWDTYRDFFLPAFPELDRCRLGHYLSSASRTIAKDPQYSNWLDWESVLKMDFAHKNAPHRPDHYGTIHPLIEDNGQRATENGLPMFIFVKP